MSPFIGVYWCHLDRGALPGFQEGPLDAERLNVRVCVCVCVPVCKHKLFTE